MVVLVLLEHFHVVVVVVGETKTKLLPVVLVLFVRWIRFGRNRILLPWEPQRSHAFYLRSAFSGTSSSSSTRVEREYEIAEMGGIPELLLPSFGQCESCAQMKFVQLSNLQGNGRDIAGKNGFFPCFGHAISRPSDNCHVEDVKRPPRLQIFDVMLLWHCGQKILGSLRLYVKNVRKLRPLSF